MPFPAAEAAGGSFGGGTGAWWDPFMVEDVLDLQAMNGDLTAFYALANDIDASATAGWNGGEGFTPIGSAVTPFTGRLEGRDFKITGLHINRPAENGVGLFGIIGMSGRVENLGLVGCSITGGAWDVGGLAGQNSGEVENCYVIGSVTGVGFVGGLIGWNVDGGMVLDSYASGTVTGTGSHVGGLVGGNEGGLTYCNASAETLGNMYVGGLVGSSGGFLGSVGESYASGATTGNEYVGGLIGLLNGAMVSECHSSGETTGDAHVGGLIGRIESGSISACYAEGDTIGNSAVGGLVGTSMISVFNSHYNVEAVLINGGHHLTIGGLYNDLYQDWLYNNRWLYITDYSGTLVPEPGGSYYTVSMALGLQHMLGFASSGYNFKLAGNIDLFDQPGLYIPYLAGDFDGNGHTISNIHVVVPFANNIGLFGHVDTTGRVDDVSVTGTIGGYENVGLLAGYYRGVRMENCFADGTVEGETNVGGLIGYNTGMVSASSSMGSVAGQQSAGGLIGWNTGDVIDSQASTGVTGDYIVGGLIGYNTNTGILTDCHAYGSVSGDYSVGGLVGWNWGSASLCSAMGDANGRESVGGLIGYNFNGMVSESHSSGIVVGTGNHVGGLIGYNDMGTVSDCSAIEDATGKEYVGGLVGYNHLGSIDRCRAEGNVSADTNYAGGLVGYNSGAVTFSYSLGDVRRLAGTRTHFGGFVGHNYRGQITGSYSTGRVIYNTGISPTNRGFTGNVDTGAGYHMADNYWDTETSLQTINAFGQAEGKTTAEMMTRSTFVVWDFANVWRIMEGKTYPFLIWEPIPPGFWDGSPGYPIPIYDVYDLQNMRNGLGLHYFLANDIDASETVGWNSGAGFEPVGSQATPFTGSLDGFNHVITGSTGLQQMMLVSSDTLARHHQSSM
ncbi:MAG: GLUG motif-containing protein [Candidatus Thermoplasmatota archaeon]|nr:GLUG motif-containing protein [Candidatus Thermoplasmatota archaeon]